MSLSTTWLEVNLNTVENNVRHVLAAAGVPLIAVVKANGYGFGAVEVGRTALKAGATMLAVARFGEARVLREAGIEAPILVLGYVTPDEVDQAIASNVTLNLFSDEIAEVYAQRTAALGKTLKVHMKIDTGLHRLGFDPAAAPEVAQRILARGGIEIEAVFSHLALSDYGDFPETRLQTQRLLDVIAAMREVGIQPRWTHLAGSSANLYEPDVRGFTMARAGTSIMGLPSRENEPLSAGIKPIYTWKARLGAIRMVPAGQGIGYEHYYHATSDELIGTLTVGYSDGYRRVDTNQVLIGGQRVPVVGRICMDMSMVRLPKAYPIGTEVVLLGRQGNEEITVEELMARWNEAEVEVTSNINTRVERVYIRD